MKNKGISLITLIITIIVVIILVTIIIITIGNNNPINQARVASVAQTRDSINSEVSTYLAKVKADTFGEYSTTEILLGNKAETLKYKVTADEITYINENEHTKEVYKLDKTKAKAHLNVELKEIDKKADWYVDEFGKVYLLYDTKADVTSYLKEGENILPALQSFVTYKANGENPISGGGNKITAEISFDISTLTKEVGDAMFQKQVTNTGDGVVTYTSSDTSVATVNENNGMVTIVSSGSTTITATVQDSENYTYAIKTASYDLTVNAVIKYNALDIYNMTPSQREAVIGKAVDLTSTNGWNDWKVFSSDGTNIALITGNYINNSLLPSGVFVTGYGPYKVVPYSSMSSFQSAINNNSNYNGFKDSNGKVTVAKIPTIQDFALSYNAVNHTGTTYGNGTPLIQKVYYKTASNGGYNVSSSSSVASTSNQAYYLVLEDTVYGDLWVPSDTSKGVSGYWLNSKSGHTDELCSICIRWSKVDYSPFASQGNGLRPIVLLDSSVYIVQHISDGVITYTIE